MPALTDFLQEPWTEASEHLPVSGPHAFGDFDNDGRRELFALTPGPGEGRGTLSFWRKLTDEWYQRWSVSKKWGNYDIHYPGSVLNIGVVDDDGVNKIMIADGPSVAILKWVDDGGDSFVMTGWSWKTIGGWNLSVNDTWCVADIDGNKRNEMLVQNNNRMAVVRATPSPALDWYAESHIDGWGLRSGDKWNAVDMNGDGREELLLHHDPYLAVLGTTDGSALTITGYFEHNIGGVAPWPVARFYPQPLEVADLYGDGSHAFVCKSHPSDLAVIMASGGTLDVRWTAHGMLKGAHGELDWPLGETRVQAYADIDDDGRSEVILRVPGWIAAAKAYGNGLEVTSRLQTGAYAHVPG